MRLFQTLRIRLLLGSFSLLLILFGIYSYFSVRFYTDQMMTQVLESANRVSDFIKSSTHYSMLLNRKEDVYQIINTIGQQPGVEGIRMYNKRGEITFSTDTREQKTVVNLQAEACYGCHDQAKPLESVPVGGRMRIYEGSDGHRILGLINPIRNEPQCSNAGCHSHPAERTVLGVLDVRMSLDKVDVGIAKAQEQFIFVAVIIVALFSVALLIFLSVTVLRPVGKLMKGTQEIASGNLGYQIPVGSKDEMGRLAHSFNEMMQSLRRAEEENRQWSQTLEQRVQQKTDELKKIHGQILQIEKMASLGKLSATVAHEINNPLEGILTYATLISRRMKKNVNLADAEKETLEDIELIKRETERCGTIVKNLLLFSKKQVGEFALVPVKQIVQKAEQLMKHHFDISNVKFCAEFPALEPLLLCDENQIQQALVALFVNAVEAMPEGGTLTVRVALTDEDISISISDAGMGIPKSDIPHAFEPFFTTKENGQGVGLGLSVVYGIVERHGGKISVDSELGKGTTFTLTFPQSSQSTDRKLAASAHVPSDDFLDKTI
ncbi:MAG: HAMP domain-containing histidine kinase [Ignavibacteriales bacterium]|nr:HAMP domain-containing histidine kinase [Ignavibacteriales bacterium]